MLEVPARRASPLSPDAARVSVVMPVRNEATEISAALESVMAQSFDSDRMEIVVVDGLSDDGTREIVELFAHGSNRLRLLDNPNRTTAAGLNLGIASTQGDIVVRVDGHVRLDRAYIQRCVDLLCETGAGNVGGPMRPQGTSLIGRAMALALCSRFGIGDSRFHYSQRQELVETVYLGAFRREVLDEVGGYDESLLANEDFELNYRIRLPGFGVLLSPDIRSAYTARETLPDIWRQFFRYGRHKASVMRKHPASIRPRHLVAPSLVAALALGSAGFLVVRRRFVLLPHILYAAAVLIASILTGRPRRLVPALLAVFPAIHLSWGAGVLSGLARAYLPERDAEEGRQGRETTGSRSMTKE